MLKKLLVVFVIILVFAVFLLTRDWDSPELGQALLDKAGETTGIKMTATVFRFNLLKGVVLEDLRARSEEPGRTFQFSMDHVVLEHRLGPLLSGTVAIERIALDKPQFEQVETGEVPPSEKEESLLSAVPPRSATCSESTSEENISTRARQSTRSCSTIASSVHGTCFRQAVTLARGIINRVPLHH
jgi:hypothetical protein